ncbi:hypothetical protein OIU77_007939 [Salix suchowensis]|uniref:Uncharacterized protein n=1 Tax=Salix suchowensis TaxID=1278906 RepID=A0ABQ9AK42_9ROSI|nr:hypothetical protein OIU77_007939 [Salix suchowensis]
MEMLSEMESLGTSKIDFGVDEIEDDDSDVEDGGDEDDDDYDEDLVAVLDDSDEEDGSDEELGDWAKLETMRLLIQCIFPKSWLRYFVHCISLT